jgi:hypothetical protein
MYNLHVSRGQEGGTERGEVTARDLDYPTFF